MNFYSIRLNKKGIYAFIILWSLEFLLLFHGIKIVKRIYIHTCPNAGMHLKTYSCNLMKEMKCDILFTKLSKLENLTDFICMMVLIR